MGNKNSGRYKKPMRITDPFIRRVMEKYSIERQDIDEDRLHVCVVGIQLCAVRNEEDVLYILRDAKNLYAAERRLRTLVMEG